MAPIGEISFKYAVQTCVFDKISTEFRFIFRVFVNFTGFLRFTWILRLHDHAKYQKPCLVVL